MNAQQAEPDISLVGAIADGKALPDHDLPTLHEIMERRGIRKSAAFDDYQDFIDSKQREGFVPKLLGLARLNVRGSMHLALGRIMSVDWLWSKGGRD